MTSRNKQRRRSLSASQRELVKEKTNGRCHICGGGLKDNDWTADHVLHRARGGKHAVDNYLPACSTCNRLRWKYRPKAVREILEIGIYAKAEIRHGMRLGRTLKELRDRRRLQNERQ